MKNGNFVKYLAGSMLFVLAALSLNPVLAEAKENGKAKKVRAEVRSELKVRNDDDGEEEDRKAKAIPPGICKLMKGGFIPFGWAKNWFGEDAAAKMGCLPRSGVSTTTPPKDIVAPVISDISNFTGNSFAIIIWNTNEKSSGKVYWAASSSVATSTANITASWNSGNKHFAVITGLTAGTNYRGLIEAKDKADNTSYSSEFGFATSGTTPAPPDTTAPIISGVSLLAGTSTANISWQTNESADSKVFYGTTTPLNTGVALFVSNSSLVSSHTLSLTGLATGTPYYMILISKDANGNTATSSQVSTTTLSN